MPAPPTWRRFLHQFAGCFTVPSQTLFEQLITAWVLCPGRHTLTRLWSVIPAEVRHPYHAYARLVRIGRWSMDELWRRLLGHLVERWVPDGPITLLLDDTLMLKTGRRVNGTGMYRDAVRSTRIHTVTARGLNIVVVGLRVLAPWGGEPLALPILVRLHRKGGATLIDMASAMMEQLAEWLPERSFCLVADGAYASLVGRRLPRTTVISRIQRNAALFEQIPPRTGRRGRPRKRGRRLPAPPGLAAEVTTWTREVVRFRGRVVRRDLWAREVLWYEPCPDHTLLLVIVRDPDGHEADDFFITTDTTAAPAEVVATYADRWAIEDSFRNVKQYLGAEDPQSWVGVGPERAVSLACWSSAAVWDWFVAVHGDRPTWPERPWYATKRTPSFADALATLRRDTWWLSIFGGSPAEPINPENAAAMLAVLAEAA